MNTPATRRRRWTGSFTLLLAAALVVPALAAAAVAAEPNSLAPEELADGWISLFDGETLFGWRPAGKVDWKVADGVLTATEGEQSLLYTTSQFGNYVLKVDFRSAAGTNSGVFLRTPPRPKNPAADCYELNIADSADSDYPSGSLVNRQRVTGDHDSADWQTFEVTADGPRFVVKLDGQTVLECRDTKPLGRGYIGLQFRQGKIEFRNVKLKPLGKKSLFNGKDLAGWKTYPDMDSVFSVTPEGWLNVKNGRGYHRALRSVRQPRPPERTSRYRKHDHRGQARQDRGHERLARLQLDRPRT